MFNRHLRQENARLNDLVAEFRKREETQDRVRERLTSENEKLAQMAHTREKKIGAISKYADRIEQSPNRVYKKVARQLRHIAATGELPKEM